MKYLLNQSYAHAKELRLKFGDINSENESQKYKEALKEVSNSIETLTDDVAILRLWQVALVVNAGKLTKNINDLESSSIALKDEIFSKLYKVEGILKSIIEMNESILNYKSDCND